MEKDWIPGDFERIPLKEHQVFELGERNLEVLLPPDIRREA